MVPPKFTLNFLATVALVCLVGTVPCLADSHVRIVRLSDVQGDVQIDRSTGQGYEKAFLNLPVTEGNKIQTKSDGKVELEFEDGSTLRIAPNTVIEVPQLSLRDSGGRLSEIHLQEGIVYVNFLGTKKEEDELDVTFAKEKLVLTREAHLRVSLADASATVAAFKGDVEVSGPSSSVKVAKGHSATFDLSDDQYKLANNIESDPFDSWDKQQGKYQQMYADNSYSSYSPYAYGTNDLNYYGSFMSLPGYGLMWQPYFVGAGWDPWMNGAWAFGPGGYGWVSAYPWGWTPYHYGSWMYMPLYGWMWQPGGAWMGWNTYPVFLNPPLGFAAPTAPSVPGRRVVPVNRGTAPAIAGNKIAIRSNSAGLGIPRGRVQNLGALSERVEQNGFASASVHSAPVASSGFGRGGFGGPSGSFRGASSGHMSAGHVSGGGHVSAGSTGHH